MNNTHFISIKILYEYFKTRYNLIVIYDDVLRLITVDVIFVFIKHQILFLKTEFEVKSEAFELLLKHDGDFSSEDEAGESVLDKAIENYLESSYLDQNSNSRQFLLSVLNSGKHIREYDDILLHAAKIGDFHVAKHIIQKGADCTVKDGAGHNVLQLWITSRKGKLVWYFN